MIYSRVVNLPKDPREIYDEALRVSFHNWVDEKSTVDNPGYLQRKPSKLSYEEAFKIIQENKPHWVVSFRNISYLSNSEEDYWEFGGCNISDNDYGEVFIWIQVTPEEAHKIFVKFNLKIE